MAEITAGSVAKLREMTGAGLMDCKKALVESNGDLDAASDYLRKKGIASAEKKASRAANEGVIAQHIQSGAKVGVLVEINCETDFVAKNDSFRTFCDDIAKKLAEENKHLTQQDIERVVGVILERMIGALEEGGRVELRGVGALAVRSRDARTGRNPRTGEPVDVRAKHVPFFKSGKELRERLNLTDE